MDKLPRWQPKPENLDFTAAPGLLLVSQRCLWLAFFAYSVMAAAPGGYLFDDALR